MKRRNTMDINIYVYISKPFKIQWIQLVTCLDHMPNTCFCLFPCPPSKFFVPPLGCRNWCKVRRFLQSKELMEVKTYYVKSFNRPLYSCTGNFLGRKNNIWYFVSIFNVIVLWFNMTWSCTPLFHLLAHICWRLGVSIFIAVVVRFGLRHFCCLLAEDAEDWVLLAEDVEDCVCL
jgi:hypothetical protein